MQSEFCFKRKKAFHWIQNRAPRRTRLLFYFTILICLLTIVSCYLKLSCYFTYGSILKESSLGSQVALYIYILAGLDIVLIIFYLGYIGIVEEIQSFHEQIVGALFVIFCGIRALFGIYTILKECYVETNNSMLESALDINLYYDLCLDLLLIPPVIFFFIRGVFDLEI